MVEIEFNFPVKEDAYKLHTKIRNTVKDTQVFTNNLLTISPVKKDDSFAEKPAWFFYIDISANQDDTNLESTIILNGGQLDLVQMGKIIWAFAI